MESVSIVPVGLSDHRDGLAKLRCFDKKSAAEVISQVKKWQDKFKSERGYNLIYLSDEFYLKAELPFPEHNDYDGFPQIENGVGLCSSLINEFKDALNNCHDTTVYNKKTIACGFCAYPVLKELVDMLNTDKISVIPIENKFFGSNITVSGLLTGTDIIDQLKNKDLGNTLLLSSSMLRHNERTLLYNTTVEDIEEALNIKIETIDNDGYELLNAILRKDEL